jgi:hypothetical protein
MVTVPQLDNPVTLQVTITSSEGQSRDFLVLCDPPVPPEPSAACDLTDP